MSTQAAMERHDKFLGEVTRFIKTFPGWDVIPTGIENHKQLKEQLKRDYTMASQYKRTEADLMVRCECLEVSFVLEAKAPHTHSFPTLAIELLPLHVHWQLSHITECVYVCEGETSRGPISVGFMPRMHTPCLIHSLFRNWHTGMMDLSVGSTTVLSLLDSNLPLIQGDSTPT